MKPYAMLIFIGLAAAQFPASTLADSNVALGKPVTLNGTYGVGGAFCGSPPSAAGSTLTDGISLPESTCWQIGSVWWDTNRPESRDNSIEIDLQGLKRLSGFTVQADNNDTYRIEYRDTNGQWQTAWDIPTVNGYGLMTRSTTLGSAVFGSSLRFTATGGDNLYSVSEIVAVPEPSSALLLVAGGALLAFMRRNKGARLA